MGRIGVDVAIVPRRCPGLGELAGRDHAWVAGAQVYSLRHRRDGLTGPPPPDDGTVPPGWEAGGDFAAVAKLARQAAGEGAAGLAISPVHAMFTADPGRDSPYSPSSRLFLNAMYASPSMVCDAGMIRPLLREGEPARTDAGGCIAWPAIQASRATQLRRLYETLVSARPGRLAEDFAAFRREGGEALARHAGYEALHAYHAGALGAGHGWMDWPADYHDPHSAAVRRFTREHEREVDFHAFLQWLAARSL